MSRTRLADCAIIACCLGATGASAKDASALASKPGENALQTELAARCDLAESAPTRIFDQTKATAEFKVAVLALFKKSGHFERFLIRLDQQGNRLRVSAVIDAQSATMKSTSDTQTLLGKDYFASEQYPHIVFCSQFFELKNEAKVQGRLSLRGQTLDQQFDLLAAECTEEDRLDCQWHVRGYIARKRFGMHKKSGVVGDAVGLILALNAAH